MSAKKSPARYRVGRVSYYQHHGSWYLYYRDSNGPQRRRVGRSQDAAERAAAQKNAELVGGQEPSPIVVPFATALTAPNAPLDRRTFAAQAAAFVGALLDLRDTSASITPAIPSAPPISVAALRSAFLDHHEHVIGSALGTVRRYAAATQHLLNFADQHGNAPQAVSATEFTRYLRTLEIAPNGHKNTRLRPLTDKGIKFILQTCGALFRFGVLHKHLPKELENPFAKLGLRRMKIRDAKPVFVFSAEQELSFLRTADRWAFAIHFMLAKTGLRPGELVHTLIEDIDLDNGWLRVRGKAELGWYVKTGTDRNVPLVPQVVTILRHVVGQRAAGLVFLRAGVADKGSAALPGGRDQLIASAQKRLEQRRHELGRQLVRREEASVLSKVWRDAGAVPVDRIRSSFMRVAKAAGINASCPKSWRHTFATLLQEANVDPLIRQITLGHKPATPEQSPLGMTSVYTHTPPQLQHREIGRALQLRPAALDLALSKIA